MEVLWFYGQYYFIEIIEASNSTTRLTTGSYPSNIYQKLLNSTFKTSYLYFGFTVNGLCGIDNIMNFAEWQLFGYEIFYRSSYISSNVLQSQIFILIAIQ